MQIMLNKKFRCSLADAYNQLAKNNYDGTSREAVSCSLLANAEYRFDEIEYTDTENEIIESIAGLHGRAKSSQPTSSGKICNAIDLSSTGINDYAILDENVLTGKTDFSISIWSKTSKTTNQSILSGAGASNNELIFWFTNHTSFRPHLKNANNGAITIPSIADDNWRHLVWTRAGSQSCLFVDKVKQGCVTQSTQSLTIQSLILGQEQDSIGGSFDANQAFNGLLDEMLIFDKAISENDVKTIYDNQNAGLNYDGSPRTCAVEKIGEWRMDEASWSGAVGEVVDETGNFNAQSKGGANTGRSSPALVGNPGTCGYGVFDGIDDYIEIPDDPKLDLETELTITAWIKPNSLPTSDLKTILSKDENYEFHLNSSGEIFWWWSASSFSTSGANISAGNWYHVAITYKSGQQYIYINGVEKGAHTYTGNLSLNSDPLQIGQDQFYGNRYFSGNIDEVQIYGSSLTVSEVNEIYNETHPCDVYLDHFEINHDGNGLTCDAETITIKACADASCSTLNTDNNVVELSVNGTANQTITVSGGSTNASFSYTDVGIATLSLDQTYTCTNGSSTSCDIEFEDAGFRFLYGAAETTSIGNQVSGNNFVDVVKLQAVKDVNGVCEGIFTANKQIELSQQNVDPNGVTGRNFKVNGVAGTSIAKYPSYTGNITLNFGADSKAIVPNPVYLDAGQIRLHAKYSEGGVNLTGTSNNFWVSPAKLELTAKSGGSDINGNTNESKIKHKAGQAFDFSVTALNSQGDITENYTPNDIELLVTRVGPSADGVDGSFNYGVGSLSSSLSPTYQDVTLSTFDEGVSSTNNASYSEVGIITVDIQDVDYGFTGNTINADAINIGRFYPDHFDVTITNNSFADTCTTDFTYIGQPFSYLNAPELTITAKNALGATTQNYTHEDYQKLIASDINRTFPNEDTAKNGKDNATKMTVSATTTEGVLSTSSSTPASSLGVMTYTFNDSDSFTYTKNANSLVGEFTSVYDIVVNGIEDSDGVNASISLASDLPTSNTVSPMGVNLRFGRWIIENTFGPERSNLTLPMAIQYYDGGSFITNTLDNCTPYDGDNDANHSLTVTALTTPLPATNLTPVSGSGDFALGLGELVIGKPTDGSQGQIRLSYDTTPTWLKFDWDGDGAFDDNPTAVATFGIFRGNDRIIYQREVHN